MNIARMAGESKRKSGANWRIVASVAAAAGVALVLAILILTEAGNSQRAYEHHAAKAAQEYRDTARIHAERACATVAPAERFECFHEQYHAAWERERNQYDLQAQLVTSAWTRAMGLAAVVAMFFGIVGVGLIYATFDATKEGNRIAHDTAYRQLRAYLSAGEATAEIWWQGGMIYAKVAGCVVNKGLTPAILKAERIWTTINNQAGGGAESPEMTEIMAPGAPHGFTNHTGTMGNAGQSIFLRVGYLFTYTDYLGEQWTELIWWKTEDVLVSANPREVKLLLAQHRSGPDDKLRWHKDEMAEWDAIAAEVNAGQSQEKDGGEA